MFTRDDDSQSSQYSESKLYVADILSSMANGGVAGTTTSTTASIATYSVPAFISGITTGTTPTLTPTTLANIEQTFIDLQSVPVSSSNGQNPLTQSGFVPPIVAPGSGSDRYDYSGDSSSCDSEYAPDIKKARLVDGQIDATGVYQHASPGRKPRRGRDEKLSPEEEVRRRVRRERNKLAAAKCRQRRVDHTNRLVNETEKLEDEKVCLENEIQELKQAKDQLEFILQAHQPLCKVERALTIKVKTEPGTATPQSQCSLSMRPSSLSLSKNEQRKAQSTVDTTLIDIPLTTPSSGFFTFGLDSMVDGHTGLTPLTQMSPNNVSCSSEVHRSSESGTDGVASPTLISL